MQRLASLIALAHPPKHGARVYDPAGSDGRLEANGAIEPLTDLVGIDIERDGAYGDDRRIGATAHRLEIKHYVVHSRLHSLRHASAAH